MFSFADKARDRTTGEIVALKKILMHKREDGEWDCINQNATHVDACNK